MRIGRLASPEGALAPTMVRCPPGNFLCRILLLPSRERGLEMRPAQARRIARHRREAVLRPGLGVALGRHHHHDRRRVLLDVEADGIEQQLGLAHLGRRHHHHALDLGVGDRIHDAALVGGTAGAPLAGLGARLRAQPSFGVSPVRDRQRRRRRQDCQRPAHRLDQAGAPLQDQGLCRPAGC